MIRVNLIMLRRFLASWIDIHGAKAAKDQRCQPNRHHTWSELLVNALDKKEIACESGDSEIERTLGWFLNSDKRTLLQLESHFLTSFSPMAYNLNATSPESYGTKRLLGGFGL